MHPLPLLSGAASVPHSTGEVYITAGKMFPGLSLTFVCVQDLKGDPSLQATQNRLKKKYTMSRQQPGPLQLVQHRILEPANSELVQAVKTLKKPLSSAPPPPPPVAAPAAVVGQRQQWNLGLQAPPPQQFPPIVQQLLT